MVQFDSPALKASIRKLLALEPERMFLTHYGLLEAPRDRRALAGHGDDYVLLAEQAAEGGDDDLMGRLNLPARLSVRSGP